MWGSKLLGNYAKAVGGAGRAATMGAAAGGLYGATLGDGMFSGMAGGAALGLGVRYGRAGARSLNNYVKGAGTMSGAARSFGGGAARRMGRDWKSTMLRANKGYNAFRARR